MQPNSWDEAVAVYKKGLVMDDTNYRFHLHLADTLTNLRNLDDAIIHYERAIALSPAKEQGEPIVGLWHVKTELADWSNWNDLLTKMKQAITSALASGQPSPLSPYQSLFLPLTQKEQLAIAESWSSRNIKEARTSNGITDPNASSLINRDDSP
jgi:tetratricopeptide (TPR) repeat protein